MKINNKIIRLKRFAKSICHCERRVAILLALALVLSLGILTTPVMANIITPGEPTFDLVTTSHFSGATNAIYTFTMTNIVDSSTNEQLKQITATIPSGYTINSTYITTTAGTKVGTMTMSGGGGDAHSADLVTTTTERVFTATYSDILCGTLTLSGDGQTFTLVIELAVYGLARTQGVLETISGFFINPTTAGIYSWPATALGYTASSTEQDCSPRGGYSQDVQIGLVHNETTGMNYSTIQSAIDAASPGDTINVAAGTYDECVSITKNLTLQGDGDATIIQPTTIAQTYNRKKVSGTESDLTNAIVVATVNVGTPNSVTIKDLKIDSSQVDSWGSGSKNVGILYQGAAGAIDNITFTGGASQDDVGDCIYASAFEETVAVEILNCDIDTSFYKNGITCNFVGLTANIHNNTVTGAGPIGTIAQNCIQIGFGATGSITDNTVSNVVYDPASSVAAGLLVSTSSATVTGNTVTDCQKGIAVQPFDAGSYTVTISDNTISSAGLKEVAHPNYVAGISVAPQNAGATITATIEDNDLTNDGPYSGIEFYGSVGTIDATVTGNEISGWTEAGIYTYPNGASVTVTINGNTFTNNVEEGIASWGQGSSTPAQTIIDNTITGSKYGILSHQTTTTAHNNNIHGNTEYGVWTDDAAVLDATNNWWGAASGPYNETTNPDGEGDAVSDNVDFIPFLSPNVTLTKTGPTTANQGNNITYTITYKNVGTFNATNAVVTETYPSEVSYVSATPEPDTDTNNKWTKDTLAPGAEGTITVTVHIE